MITNLTQLKKSLKVGSILQLIDTNLSNHPSLNFNREIVHKQSNAIKFANGCWLYFGESKYYSFNGDTFTYDETKGDSEAEKVYGAVLTYKIVSL